MGHYVQVNKYNKHLGGLKDKNHLIILIDKHKVFNKICHACMMTVM